MVVKIKPFLKNLLGRLPVIRRFAGDEKGVTLVYVAISLPVILGFAGLGVAIAVLTLAKREPQSMADAAALASARRLMPRGDLSTPAGSAPACARRRGSRARSSGTGLNTAQRKNSWRPSRSRSAAGRRRTREP